MVDRIGWTVPKFMDEPELDGVARIGGVPLLELVS